MSEFTYIPRQEQCAALFPNLPAFRWRQIEAALLKPNVKGWDTVSTLSKDMRAQLSATIPWNSLKLVTVQTNKTKDTYKALLATVEGNKFETVLMANARDQWTICVSSQIGCAMRCAFCATGAMGLTRSLHADEIIDQYRFWQQFLAERPDLPQRISNIVFMGMGEPLTNYEQVKAAIHALLKNTDLGPTHIIVSTVGVLPQLERLLTDPDWPHVRIAISLHSANPARRKEIVPTSFPEFLSKLAAWSHRYQTILGNRRHYLTFEYTLIDGVNDTPAHAKELAAYTHKTAIKKINVIPLNPVPGKPFSRSQQGNIDAFKKILLDAGVNVTQRKTMGDDIAAACGQLAYNEENPHLP